MKLHNPGTIEVDISCDGDTVDMVVSGPGFYHSTDFTPAQARALGFLLIHYAEEAEPAVVAHARVDVLNSCGTIDSDILQKRGYL